MIAQILLSLLLSGIVVYAWADYRRSPVVALLFMLTAAAGIYLVWTPSHATQLAELAGVGERVNGQAIRQRDRGDQRLAAINAAGQ